MKSEIWKKSEKKELIIFSDFYLEVESDRSYNEERT